MPYFYKKMSVKMMYTFLHTIYVPTNIDGGLNCFMFVLSL